VLAGSSENTVYFQQVALIGTGLIGGSIGMALRENNLAAHITCYDRDPGAAGVGGGVGGVV